MPTYKVIDGASLGHAGLVHEGGAIIELPRSVADDMAVRGLVTEVDKNGKPVVTEAPDELARFKTHERVTLLTHRRDECQRRLDELNAQLAVEETKLIEEVRAIQAANPAPVPAPAQTQKAKE